MGGLKGEKVREKEIQRIKVGPAKRWGKDGHTHIQRKEEEVLVVGGTSSNEWGWVGWGGVCGWK